MQTLPDISGASAAVVAERLQRLLQLAARSIGDDAAAAAPADLPELAKAIADGGGTFIAFVSAMMACLLAAEPAADSADGSSKSAVAAALDALGLPHAAAAQTAAERLNDVALRMEGSHWITALHEEYAAAVARRMDISPPRAVAKEQPPAADASQASAATQTPGEKASARAADQAVRLQRALHTGGWSWSLPPADAADVLRDLGYERAMGLSRMQTDAFVEALCSGGSVAFGELATALCVWRHALCRI